LNFWERRGLGGDQGKRRNGAHPDRRKCTEDQESLRIESAGEKGIHWKKEHL